jgi:DNA-binding IclR family transcriptional regulator
MGKSRSALRTISILEIIAREKRGVTLSDVATELDIPITSASDIIKALVESEMIEIIDERSKVYGIGVKAFFIGNAFLSNTDLIAKAKPIIEDLGTLLNKTVFMGKAVNDEITYIYKYEPMATIVTTCAIGSRTFIHCTSLGKSIVAYDDELWKMIQNKSLTKKTSHTITDHDQLLEDIQKVRIRGYAIDDREQNESLLCVGAPIFDHTGKVIAALSISGLYTKDANVAYEGEVVREKAMLISQKMGYINQR